MGGIGIRGQRERDGGGKEDRRESGRGRRPKAEVGSGTCEIGGRLGVTTGITVPGRVLSFGFP